MNQKNQLSNFAFSFSFLDANFLFLSISQMPNTSKITVDVFAQIKLYSTSTPATIVRPNFFLLKSAKFSDLQFFQMSQTQSIKEMSSHSILGMHGHGKTYAAPASDAATCEGRHCSRVGAVSSFFFFFFSTTCADSR